MSDNDSCGSSWLENIIFTALLAYLFYLLVLAIPIIPYFDLVLKVVLFIHTPESFFGKIILFASLFLVGYLMLEFVKNVGSHIFFDKLAMDLFLYGQGLILIAFMGSSDNTNFYVSKFFVTIMSFGFAEVKENMKIYLAVVGLLTLAIALMLESNRRSSQKVFTPNEYIDDLVYKRQKLKIIEQANRILSEQRALSSFEKTIVQKAEEYKKMFTQEELSDIPSAMKKYMSYNRNK